MLGALYFGQDEVGSLVIEWRDQAMKLRKAAIALAMSGLMVFSLGAMAGCADNSEQVIRDSLTQEFEQLKNPDEALLSEMSSSIPEASLSQLGLSVDDVMRSMLTGFEGTVDSVTVNGNTADAVVTVSSKDFTQIEEAMTNLQSDMMDNVDQFADMSTDEIYAWAGQKIMEAIESAPVETHEPITLQYEREGNTWEPTAGAKSELYSALFG